MLREEHSRTAALVAFIRAQHALHDRPPILDDPYAQTLLSTEEIALFEAVYTRDALALGLCEHGAKQPLARFLREASAAPIVLSRARYAEDRLERAVARGVDQYVLVGAGLDTFVFRHIHLADRLHVFELDHPHSQRDKTRRLERAGLSARNLYFAPIDFEQESIATALQRSGFKADKPALFAWLGVTYYLSENAIENALRAMAEVAAPGSELVFDAYSPEIFLERAPALITRMLARTRVLGEPIITGLDRATVVRMLGSWRLLEWLDHIEIEQRYFSQRTDGYHAFGPGQLACLGIEAEQV